MKLKIVAVAILLCSTHLYSMDDNGKTIVRTPSDLATHIQRVQSKKFNTSLESLHSALCGYNPEAVSQALSILRQIITISPEHKDEWRQRESFEALALSKAYYNLTKARLYDFDNPSLHDPCSDLRNRIFTRHCNAVKNQMLVKSFDREVKKIKSKQ